jgi:hypothetical protein
MLLSLLAGLLEDLPPRLEIALCLSGFIDANPRFDLPVFLTAAG